MTFRSILFSDTVGSAPEDRSAVPDCFVDLRLDQIVAAITAGKEEYDLAPFFHAPLHDADAVAWRHEIMRDLEDPGLFDAIGAFARDMRAMRRHLAQADTLSFPLERQRWFLDSVGIYCAAVARLAGDLSVAECASRGLSAFRDHLSRYAASGSFTALRNRTEALEEDLAGIRYAVLVDGLRVRVRRFEGEPDYAAEVEKTFEKFRQGAVKEYTFQFAESSHMNHVEEQIAALVARLYPEIFSSLQAYCAENREFADDTIVRFDREVQFYVAWLEHLARFRETDLSFCYPRVTRESKEVSGVGVFDLALAGTLLGEGRPVVTNDFHLCGRERIVVVSGPNQGGKTTFARTFGQLHYLASLGCPVPGSRAQLFLCDGLFTHFEREETLDNLRGKLQDDLVRVRRILVRATGDSIIILNEVFTSTTLRDAIVLSRKIAARIMALDALCVWVTFVDELAFLGEQTVSMVSTVTPENPALRTYKIVRRPADGLAYAMSIAEKYRLTYGAIRKRVGP